MQAKKLREVANVDTVVSLRALLVQQANGTDWLNARLKAANKRTLTAGHTGDSRALTIIVGAKSGQ